MKLLHVFHVQHRRGYNGDVIRNLPRLAYDWLNADEEAFTGKQSYNYVELIDDLPPNFVNDEDDTERSEGSLRMELSVPITNTEQADEGKIGFVLCKKFSGLVLDSGWKPYNVSSYVTRI